MIGGKTFDLRTDPTVIRVLIQSAMTVVEEFKNSDGKGWNGPEKKRIALSLIQYIIHDLSVNGKINPATAEAINDNIYFIGIAIDVAVDAANLMFNVGQNFVKDAKTSGCKASCRKNCCFGF